ncbi:MAG TPA: HupE/UreJ family protein [Vicinamibacterales bacterium]
MAPRLQRARRRPGPLTFTIALLLITTAVVRAHDPGLSTLDVSVSGHSVSVMLSMSASDVALAVHTHAEVPGTVRRLAHESIHLSFADRALAPGGTDVALVEGSARVRLSYELPNTSSTNRLTISSDIPKRLARGHRELLTVTAGRAATTESLLDASSNPVTIDVTSDAGWPTRAWSFLTLGIHHILTGYDHLVFLAGLILAACTLRQLLVALTAFTAAHSMSLALVVIAGVRAPSSIVEPLIAASIAWVGLENLLREQTRTPRLASLARGNARWMVVFGFGLIHGFGFADALIELGFGTSMTDIATALVSFNGGVEIGQLAAAAAMLPLVWLLRSRPAWQRRFVPVCSLLIVIAGGYWLVERL